MGLRFKKVDHVTLEVLNFALRARRETVEKTPGGRADPVCRVLHNELKRLTGRQGADEPHELLEKAKDAYARGICMGLVGSGPVDSGGAGRGDPAGGLPEAHGAAAS